MKLVSKFIFLGLALAIFSPSKVSALSCAQTIPIVATVEDISIQEDGSHIISLKWPYTFKETRINSLSTIDIDSYSEIIKEYIDDDLEFLEEIDSDNKDFKASQIKLEAQKAQLLDIEVDDLYLSGPPKHTCDFGFTGIFNERGILKKALIKDSFQSYSYLDLDINVSPSQEILCKGYNCSVKIEFKFADEDISLVPGQLYQPENSTLTSIKVLDSQFPQKGVDADALFPFGSGKLSSYILSFNENIDIDQTLKKARELKEQKVENNKDQASSSQEIESPEKDEEGSPVNQGTEAPKRKNIFSRIFSWIKSLFSR